MREAITKSRRSRQITQGLTLLCGIDHIVLSLAFARPYVRQVVLFLLVVSVVLLVLDSSGSMQSRGSGMRFLNWVNWAQLVLDGLQEGDRVGLLAPSISSGFLLFLI